MSRDEEKNIIDDMKEFTKDLKNGHIRVHPLTKEEKDAGKKNYVWVSVSKPSQDDARTTVDYFVELHEVNKKYIFELMQKTCQKLSTVDNVFDCETIKQLIDNAEDDFYTKHGIACACDKKEWYIMFHFDRYTWHDFPVLEVA